MLTRPQADERREPNDAEHEPRTSPRSRAPMIAACASLLGATVALMTFLGLQRSGPSGTAPSTTHIAHPCGGKGTVPNNTLPLRYCNEGAGIKLVQRALNSLMDAGLDEDGQLGPKTRDAVTAFQAKHGLATSGDIDAETWYTLFPPGELGGTDRNSNGHIEPDEVADQS